MVNVELGSEDIVYCGSTSVGTQQKYVKDSWWYKEDRFGGEGLSEYLASLVCLNSSLSPNQYVVYEQCFINGSPGCRSRDFAGSKYKFISLERAHKAITGIGLQETVYPMYNFIDRVSYTVSFFSKYYGLDLKAYLSRVFSLDLLTLNEDRHFNNLGFLQSGQGGYIEAPLFDSGMSLLVGNVSVSNVFPLAENVKRVCSKPFSGSHLVQFKEFGVGFSIDYIGLLSSLSSMAGNQLEVLYHQLGLYKSIFFKYSLSALLYRGKRVGTRIFSCGRVYDTSIILGGSDIENVEVSVVDGFYMSMEELKGLDVVQASSKIVLEAFNGI